MALRPVVSHQAPDRSTQSGLDALGASVSQILRSPIIDGVLIEGIDLSPAASVSVAHKLGRTALGYLVVARDADAVIWNETSTRPELFLLLNSSAVVTVSLWVF